MTNTPTITVRSPATGTFLLARWPLALGVGLGIASFGAGAGWVPSGNLTLALPGLALSYLIFGAARRHLRQPGVLNQQLLGLAVLGLLAAVALVVDPTIGRYVVATGWLGHAVWDLWHHRLDRVVPRWYAEFCVVFDVLVATSLVAGPHL